MEPQRSQRNTLCPQKEFFLRDKRKTTVPVDRLGGRNRSYESLLQKYHKSIEKKSSPQELERIGTEFFISVP